MSSAEGVESLPLIAMRAEPDSGPDQDEEGVSPTESGHAGTDAAWAGGRATEPPATDPGKIIEKAAPLSAREWGRLQAEKSPPWSEERWQLFAAHFGVELHPKPGRVSRANEGRVDQD